MRAINHAVTGAVIGLGVSNPALAVPLAFGSHFVCDALPHYGANTAGNGYLRSVRFVTLLVVDALLCVLLVAALALTQPYNWLWVSVCAFVATIPDIFWLPGWLRARRGQAFAQVNRNWFMVFAKRIQWFERPIGAAVELVWLSVGVAIIITYL